TVTWEPGALAAGQAWLASVRLRPRQDGDWACAARARADRLAEARATRTVQVTGGAALAVEVLDPAGALAVGAEARQDLVVPSRGAATGRNVRLSVRSGEGLTLLAPEGPTAATGNGHLIRFGPLPQLEGHARAVYRVRVRGLRPGDWRLQVELAADGQA